MFSLKQIVTIHHQKQLATESGRIKIRTFVDRYQHFKSLHYVDIHVVDLTCTLSVWLCSICDSQGFQPQISLLTFTTLNWVKNHVVIALLETLNIEGPVEKYFLSITVTVH